MTELVNTYKLCTNSGTSVVCSCGAPIFESDVRRRSVMVFCKIANMYGLKVADEN